MPWQIARETRYIMFGPGVRTIPSEIGAKPQRTAEFNMRGFIAC